MVIVSMPPQAQTKPLSIPNTCAHATSRIASVESARLRTEDMLETKMIETLIYSMFFTMAQHRVRFSL